MRRYASVALIAVALLFGACSKTQDTAPETRLFGAPPVIQNATLVQSSSVGTATCDITDAFKGFLCMAGFPINTLNIQPLSVTVHYSEAQISVHATDPDSVPGGQNDILLVSASYQSSNQGSVPVESSLVVLDDGSTNQFNYKQVTFEVLQACQAADPILCGDPSVSCGPAEFKLTSNDTVLNDDTWTRGFALVAGTQDTLLTSPAGINVGSKSTIASDCIAKVKGQFPAIAAVPVGSDVKFKIEVVDRAGNLTQWPQPLTTTFGKTTWDCGPDICACCVLLSSDPGTDCHNKPGLVSPPTYPNGLCVDAL
jgi:hypothetical protein